jgi:DNA helicase-2/ATP-dependent DNA helicase PcrA
VYVLNVADGNFPSEFSTGKPEMIEEERRLLYVAITRARNELHLCAPLKYSVTQQAKTGDVHVYGAKSRFMTDKVLGFFEQATFRSHRSIENLHAADTVTVNVAAALKDMW